MSIIKKLYGLRLLQPKSVLLFLQAMAENGINLMTLLAWIAKLYPEKIAIKTPFETISYRALHEKSQEFALFLSQKHAIRAKTKIGIFCKNDLPFIYSIFAASRLGASIFLLNTDMSKQQFCDLSENHFDFLIYENDFEEFFKNINLPKNTLNFSHFKNEKTNARPLLNRIFSSKIIVLSGGTTGKFKTAARKTSVFTFLNPFFSLIDQLNLPLFAKTCIAVPFYHGYGLATLFFAISLAAEIHILPRFNGKFNAKNTLDLLEKQAIQVFVCVPLMLHRLLENENLNPQKIDNLSHIISGGATISPILVRKTQQIFGHKLYNLYGTSEAGFALIAAPNDLKKHENTIGKPIFGVKISILNQNENKIGEIMLKTGLAMLNNTQNCIKTGDLGYKNNENYVFLAGRIDEMIVSGGENVYPIVLEQALAEHPDVAEVAVIGIEDHEFGQRLAAFVVLKKEAKNFEKATELQLKDWLKLRVARFEMPKRIVFIEEMKYTALSKPDKKSLAQMIEA